MDNFNIKKQCSDSNIIEITKALIKIFRKCCLSAGLFEENSISLISHHDKSIRFTNSTTSVFKSFMSTYGTLDKSNGAFLIQPAMGLQGYNYWIKNNKFGNFSSFFYSFGTMSAFKDSKECVQLAYKVVSKIFPLQKDILLYCYYKDTDIINLVSSNFENVQIIKNTNMKFRHTYGLDNVVGRDALLAYENNGEKIIYGNISIIEIDGIPSFIEFSFDSTLIISALLKEHAVFCLPSVYSIGALDTKNTLDYKLALCDFLDLLCNLVIEGLDFGSRGRSRNLRKILEEIIELCKIFDITKDSLMKMIYDTCKRELTIRKILKTHTKNIDADGVVSIVNAEINQYYNF